MLLTAGAGYGVWKRSDVHGGISGAAKSAAPATRGTLHPSRRLRGAEAGRCVQSSASPAEKVSQVTGLGGAHHHLDR